MSGRTLWHLPSRSKKQRTTPIQRQLDKQILDNTIPAVFNRAGYDTFRTCKIGNSYSEANQLFKMVRDKTCRQSSFEQGSQWHAQQVLQFLDSRVATNNDNPFLIYLGFSHPHDARMGREELLKKYGALNVADPPSAINPNSPPLPATWLPRHPFHHGHPGLRDEVNVPGVKKSRSPATIRNELGREFACIENIDQQIGLVLEKLGTYGELKNTFVIFTSDHGIAVGRHGLAGKQNLYEHTWRVPFLVVGPGISKATRADGNAYLLDMLPTLCDLAGIAVPTTAQGRSLQPVLMGQTTSVRDVLYGCYCGGTKPGMRCVRTGDWKLIKYDTMDGQVRETQLFNLAENPLELLLEHQSQKVTEATGNRPAPQQIDLAELPEYAAKRRELESVLLNEMIRLQDPYRLWDQPPIKD